VDQAPTLKKNATSLDKMRSQLQGGRFRMLNEQLYTTTGGEAFDLMQVRPAECSPGGMRWPFDKFIAARCRPRPSAQWQNGALGTHPFASYYLRADLVAAPK
jgi:hypothetical protein